MSVISHPEDFPSPEATLGDRTFANVYEAKRATIIVEVAGALAIGKARLYDLKDPTEAADFAEKMHEDEEQNGSRVTIDGKRRDPRTADEIRLEVVEPRAAAGDKGVVIIASRSVAFGRLWDRVNELDPPRV